MYGIIATWRMSLEGICEEIEDLKNNGTIENALVNAISAVEDFPYYKSVGYGGLPNEEMEVELDAAFMNGDNMAIGAVAGIKDFANPVKIACQLSKEYLNNMLVGNGAEKYAHKNGFERKNMLSERAKIHYHNKRKELQLAEKEIGTMKAYRGHDTVGMVGVDTLGSVAAATSTSGLFLKKQGRVGDSALSGSGFYADSKVGAATATGLGEDLMKGCISYEIVRLMKQGHSAQLACEMAVNELEKELIERVGEAGDISVVAMSKNGEFGAASTIENFSFVVANEQTPPSVFLVKRDGKHHLHIPATKEWLENYLTTRMMPLEKK
ncbi:glycosylasparaginase precursor. Threonine peptidase. MEROPS family T02 [Pilibacter termitis]|uniref:Glycosylasparaginase. Threonine peptidase. MEROPS family T02 n=1 Tax=Pilibacter termitis TaxID=263852 RepID=A0A1T4QEF4_9ENTE|nr:N(4)-(beta-N-acetylglucosaminyl)-L-asparaginase [Pilibacter termitis]SKA02016.1 glycosylasparaginase precursor. Threonine peptidase. MEROPS family T02 [Pilibacter termitis]